MIFLSGRLSMQCNFVALWITSAALQTGKLVERFRTQVECGECERFVRSSDRFEYGFALRGTYSGDMVIFCREFAAPPAFRTFRIPLSSDFSKAR